MKKVGIFYGSTTGDCERIAKSIAAKLGVDQANVKSVSELTADCASQYDVFLFGSSTWGYGDLQDDWESGISVLKKMDLNGKTVAVFGCGDSASYSDTYCNAMGSIYDAIEKSGANIVGSIVSTDGYTFDESSAARGGVFVGLALDEVNESDKTEERITTWVEEIKKNFD